jgi:hypothetical protein
MPAPSVRVYLAFSEREEKLMAEQKVIAVKHAQELGSDVIRIFHPSGYEILIGRWPLNTDKTPLENATDALWSGYFKAEELIERFGATSITLHSAVPGAGKAFDEQYHEELKDGEE